MPEITELTDIEAERVDGVKSPASGFPFLMMKSISTDSANDTGAMEKAEEQSVAETDATKEAEAAPATDAEQTSAPEAAEKDTPDVESLVKEAVAKAGESYEEAIKELRDELAKVRATPLPGGPAVTAPAGIHADKRRVELLKEAAYYDNMADSINEQDMKVHYRAKAAAARDAAKA